MSRRKTLIKLQFWVLNLNFSPKYTAMVSLTACSFTNTTTGQADTNKLGGNKNTKSTDLRLRSADFVAVTTMWLSLSTNTDLLQDNRWNIQTTNSIPNLMLETEFNVIFDPSSTSMNRSDAI